MRKKKSFTSKPPSIPPHPEKPPAKWLVWSCLVLIIVSTIIAYSGTLKNGFVHFDDTVYITENPHVLGGLTPSTAAWAFSAFHATNWHPLTWLSHQLDVTLFGLAPAGHHAVGLAIHVLTALVLFGFLRSVTSSLLAALVTAMLFALHPLHVESVAWASERKDVLSAFFWFATLWAYAGYAKKKGAVRYGITVALFALGLMAKPMLVMLPVVLLLLDYWPLGRFTKGIKSLPRLLLEKIPLCVLTLVSVVLTIIAQQEAIATLEKVSLYERLTNAVVSYGVYLWQMVWPAGLAVFYPYSARPEIIAGITVLGLLVAITIMIIWYGKRYPFLVTGWFWYLVTLVPVIGIVQVGAQAHADRYTYIPLTGIFIMIAWGVRSITQREGNTLRKRVGYAAAVLLLLLGVKTYYQVQTWKDDPALFSHAQAVVKNNYVALNNLGQYYDQSGRTNEALEFFRRALAAKPDFAEALNNVGNVMRRNGRPGEAILYFRKALECNPGLAVVHSNLGVELAKTGNVDEAEKHYQNAIRLKPEYADAFYNYGILLAGWGRYAEAVSILRKAVALAPDSCEVHNNLGLVLARTGVVDEAAAAYRKALALKPGYAEAWNNLGILYTVTGRTDSAIAAYRKSLELDPGNASSFNNLGYILLQAEKFKEAAEVLEKALVLLPGNPRILTNLADAALGQGNAAEARRLLKQALEIARQSGDTLQIAEIRLKMKTLK